MTRHRLTYAIGTAKEKWRYKSGRSFWWNLIVYFIIGSLIVLLAHAAFDSNDSRSAPAPVVRLVAAQQPQSLPEPPGGSVRTVRQFHLNFKKGVYSHWPKGYHYSGSYKRAWIKSANRHLHNRAKAHRYYTRMIRTTSCQAAMYNTLTCRMKFPSVRYNWQHPADANTKWVLRVAWCGTVAITEYYTRGTATRTLRAVGGKAMGLCLPAYLIP